MHRVTQKTAHVSPRAVTLAAALALGGCGGGGSSGGGTEPPPPPPQEPPVVSTLTAVRVSAPTPFGAGCLALPANATLYANAEVEPHLAINPGNPNHLVAGWQQDRTSDGGARGQLTAVSIDGGATWSSLQSAPFSQCAGGAFARVSDPWVAISSNAVIQVGISFTGAALTAGAHSTVLASRSLDGGITWGAAITLAEDDGALFFNDKESVTIDATDPRYVYAVWDKLDTNDHGPTYMARSVDGGATWLPATPIYDPGASRQTLGNVALTTPDGVVHVFFTELGPAAGNPAQLEGHLAVIRSANKGVTWSAPRTIADLRPVGTRIPGQSDVVVRAGEDLGSFAADPESGALYAVWHDARFTSGARNAIVVSRSTDGGATWSAPASLNANTAVPAFTPTVAALAGGVVGVTYYDFRQAGTTTYQPTDLWLAVSRNGGLAWSETRLAGNFDLLDAPNANGLFVGDYQGLVGAGSTFMALYARTNNGDVNNRTDVFADRLDADSIAAVVAHSSDASQKAGAQTWTADAQERVSLHLAALRAMRRAQWQGWLNSATQPSR